MEIEYLGRRVHTIVVFAKGKDSEVFGLHALEGLSLEVDPSGKKLRRSKAIKAFLIQE